MGFHFSMLFVSDFAVHRTWSCWLEHGSIETDHGFGERNIYLVVLYEMEDGSQVLKDGLFVICLVGLAIILCGSSFLNYPCTCLGFDPRFFPSQPWLHLGFKPWCRSLCYGLTLGLCHCLFWHYTGIWDSLCWFRHVASCQQPSFMSEFLYFDKQTPCGTSQTGALWEHLPHLVGS